MTERVPFTHVERFALAIGIALVLVMAWMTRADVTDDTFVHLQYARNLAEGHGLVFNPGERVYGCTSPLWVALLADGVALGLGSVGFAKVLGTLASVAAVGLFLQLMRRTVSTPAVRAAATVAWASHAWMARWTTSGMETPLAVALVVAGFVAFTEGKRFGARPLRTGALWALAALTRPEAMLLLMLWGITLLIEAEDRFGLRRLLAGTLPPLLIVGAWLGFARLYFSTFWPQSLAAKVAGGPSPRFPLAHLEDQLRLAATTDGVLLLLLLAACVLGRLLSFPPARLAQRWLPWAWVASLPVLYAARDVPALSRYILILLPIIGWLAWRAAEAWWLGRAPTPARVRRAAVFATVVAAAVVAQNLVVFRGSVMPTIAAHGPALESSLIEWGRWLGEHTPPGTTVAASEIGAVGYFSRRPVVDLSGLVTPAMAPRLVRQSQEQAVSSFAFAAFSRPDYLIDRAPEAYRLLRSSRFGGALAPLGRANVPVIEADHRPPAVYTFYRIDWAAFDSLRATTAR